MPVAPSIPGLLQLYGIKWAWLAHPLLRFRRWGIRDSLRFERLLNCPRVTIHVHEHLTECIAGGLLHILINQVQRIIPLHLLQPIHSEMVVVASVVELQYEPGQAAKYVWAIAHRKGGGIPGHIATPPMRAGSLLALVALYGSLPILQIPLGINPLIFVPIQTS